MAASPSNNLARRQRPTGAALRSGDAVRDGDERSRSNIVARRTTRFGNAFAVHETRETRKTPQSSETLRVKSDRSAAAARDHLSPMQLVADQEESCCPRRVPFPRSNPNETWSLRMNNSILSLAPAQSVAGVGTAIGAHSAVYAGQRAKAESE